MFTICFPFLKKKNHSLTYNYMLLFLYFTQEKLYAQSPNFSSHLKKLFQLRLLFPQLKRSFYSPSLINTSSICPDQKSALNFHQSPAFNPDDYSLLLNPLLLIHPPLSCSSSSILLLSYFMITVVSITQVSISDIFSSLCTLFPQRIPSSSLPLYTIFMLMTP